jgi:hypothetical protein
MPLRKAPFSLPSGRLTRPPGGQRIRLLRGRLVLVLPAWFMTRWQVPIVGHSCRQ